MIGKQLMPKIYKISEECQEIEDIVELRETIRDLPFISLYIDDEEADIDDISKKTSEMIIDYINVINDSANLLVSFMDEKDLWDEFYDWDNLKTVNM